MTYVSGDVSPWDMDVLLGNRSVSRVNPGSVGIRIFGGRTEKVQSLPSDVTGGRTYEVLTTTALHFDAIRLIFAVGQTSGVNAITPTIAAAATTVGDPSDATISAATWVNATIGGTNNIGGSATGTLAPAAALGRRVFTLSDIIPVASVARTDGGTYPLLVARAYLYTGGSAGNVILQGNGTDSFANWATHPSGRIWRLLGKGGGSGFAQANQAGMTSANSAVENGSPIVGIIYYARGKVVNVAGFGDSITEGRGTYIGEGFGFPACQALSDNDAGVAYEWSNLGWSGQNLTSIRQNLIDAVATAGLKWDIGVLPGGSPNDISTTIAASDIAASRLKAVHMVDLMRNAGMLPILWTWPPSNTAVKNYGATDSLRRALNDDYRAWASHGAVIADFDAALAGVTSSGQVQMLAGTTSDNIHPNDAGNALLDALLQSAISRNVIAPSGALVA